MDEHFLNTWIKKQKKELKIKDFLSEGNNGIVYETNCNKVIKITKCHNEFVVAHKLKNNNSLNVVKIHDLDIFQGELIIVMEKLKTDRNTNIEKDFSEINFISQDLGCDILEIDINDEYDMSDSAYVLLESIQNAAQQCFMNGVHPCDIHEGNIGIDQKGNYKIFDQIDNWINTKKEYNLIKKLYKKKKKKLTY